MKAFIKNEECKAKEFMDSSFSMSISNSCKKAEAILCAAQKDSERILKKAHAKARKTIDEIKHKEMKKLRDQIEKEIFDKAKNAFHRSTTISHGHLLSIKGLLVKAEIRGVSIGDLVEIKNRNGNINLDCKVCGFDQTGVVLSPLGSVKGISPNAEVIAHHKKFNFQPNENFIGTVINSRGKIIFSQKNISSINPLKNDLLPTLSKDILDQHPSTKRLVTGIRAIDAFCPLAKGQKICLFAEPGVGKTTLMEMLCRNCPADLKVLALIGERKREVIEFIQLMREGALGDSTIIVFSTSDEAAELRAMAIDIALQISEHFAASGNDVLLQVDSLTRLARAWREAGLSAGEIPVRQGYPASAFAMLPSIIERAGSWKCGSITALFTALLSCGISEDPITEEIKGITDGHVIMSRSMSESGIFPAIDIGSSISRLQEKIENHMETKQIRKLFIRLTREKDLIALGGTKDEEMTKALEIEGAIYNFIEQGKREASSIEDTKEKLKTLTTMLST